MTSGGLLRRRGHADPGARRSGRPVRAGRRPLRRRRRSEGARARVPPRVPRRAAHGVPGRAGRVACPDSSARSGGVSCGTSSPAPGSCRGSPRRRSTRTSTPSTGTSRTRRRGTSSPTWCRRCPRSAPWAARWHRQQLRQPRPADPGRTGPRAVVRVGDAVEPGRRDQAGPRRSSRAPSRSTGSTRPGVPRRGLARGGWRRSPGRGPPRRPDRPERASCGPPRPRAGDSLVHLPAMVRDATDGRAVSRRLDPGASGRRAAATGRASRRPRPPPRATPLPGRRSNRRAAGGGAAVSTRSENTQAPQRSGTPS